MKVLMIGAGRNLKGGVSAVVNQYYEAGLDKKVELQYLATMDEGGKLHKLLVAARALNRFKRIIEQFDIVHVHMSKGASFYRKSRFIKIAKRRGKKIIIHMHSGAIDRFYEEKCNEKQKKYFRSIFQSADRIIVLSESWKVFFSKICEVSCIKVVPNSIMMPEFHRKTFANNNVLTLGRLGENKGTYDLLRVIPNILKKHPEVHFYLGGDGEIEKCKKIVKESGISSNVSILGWVTGESKQSLLEQCSVFVLPSYSEGLPMSLLEAMSFGNIVIATEVGGIPQVIQDGVNGILITPGNVEQLENNLMRAIEGQYDEMGTFAYNTINKKYNLSTNISCLIDIYSELVK